AERSSSMATYRLGQATQSVTVPPTFRRPLICEVCLEALGNVPSGGAPRGPLCPAGPRQVAVERHDVSCRPANTKQVTHTRCRPIVSRPPYIRRRRQVSYHRSDVKRVVEPRLF